MDEISTTVFPKKSQKYIEVTHNVRFKNKEHMMAVDTLLRDTFRNNFCAYPIDPISAITVP